MIIRGLSSIPIIMGEIGIPKIKQGEIWIVPDSNIGSSFQALYRAQGDNLISINPNMLLNEGASIIIKSVDPILDIMVYIVDNANNSFFASRGAVNISRCQFPTRFKITNIIIPPSDLTIYIEAVGAP